MKEFGFNLAVGGVGLFATYYLGGWDAALKALIAFMILDYVTGVLAAIKSKNLNSEVAFWGGIRKGAVLAVIVVAVILDGLIGHSEPIFRTLVIYFYVAREGLSIFENFGLLGVAYPSAIKNVLTQLQEKGESK